MSSKRGLAAAELSGRIALVIDGGAAGRTIAQALAAAGATVAIGTRSRQEAKQTAVAIEAAGGRALGFSVDVMDQAALERMVSQIERRMGPIDILVNGAACAAPDGPDAEPRSEQRRRNGEAGFRGAFLCTRVVLPRMLARRQGRIINLACHAASRSPGCGPSAPCHEANVVQFTRGLAAATSDYGVGVSALSLDNLSGEPPERVSRLALLLASGQVDAFSGGVFHMSGDEAYLAQSRPSIQAERSRAQGLGA